MRGERTKQYIEGYGDPRRVTVDDWVVIIALLGLLVAILALSL